MDKKLFNCNRIDFEKLLHMLKLMTSERKQFQISLPRFFNYRFSHSSFRAIISIGTHFHCYWLNYVTP